MNRNENATADQGEIVSLLRDEELEAVNGGYIILSRDGGWIMLELKNPPGPRAEHFSWG